MHNRGLKALILTTALAPSLLIALALGIYFNNSRVDDIDNLLEQRSRATALQLANVARLSLRGGDTSTLQEITALALEEPGINSIAIFDARQRSIAHAGPLLSGGRLPPMTAVESYDRDAATLRVSMPILPASAFTGAFDEGAEKASAPLGWVAIEYSRAPYQVDAYQSLFFGSMIVILALIGAVTIAVFASRRLEAAVTTLRAGIQRIAQGDFDTPVQLRGDDTLLSLADHLNGMAATVQRAAVELRRNLEQTNRDLRESLETVEIQNIELDLARREALEASRIKSEFLANTSHELRTPLNGIIGFSKLLLKSVLDARQRDYLETIQLSAEALLGIINDILDFSKMEAGKLILDNVPFNLREVIEDVLAMLAPSANEKKLELILLCEPDVPTDLFGDPLRLRQIMTNLISNAIKFTERGHIAIRIELTAPIGARVPVRISVSDTGIGIDVQHQHQLFQAFMQADASTSREFGGTGLGLAISKRLVEHMGGEIGLSSVLGEGSTFWFSLRLPAQESALHKRQFGQLGGRAMLVWDSNPLSRQALAQLLQSWNIEVIEAGDALALPPGAADCDGWLVNLPADAQLPATALPPKIPVWILHVGAGARPADKRTRLLAKPVGHIQLYDALCNVWCSRPLAAETGHSTRVGHALQVLAVDDNATNLKLIAILLEEFGASAVLASNGHEALTLCDEQRFDLILLDIQMPELNGAQVAEMIRGGAGPNRDTQIVALTAHLLAEEQRRLLAEGFDECLTKPITEKQLRKLLDNCLPAATAMQQPVHLALSLERARQKPELAKEFLCDLLGELPRAHAMLSQHLLQNDFDAVLEETHRLHGASCYCGVPALQHHSRALEELLKQNGETAAITAAAQALLETIDELLVWEEQHDIDVLFDVDAGEITTISG